MTAANRRADTARDEAVFAFAAVLVAALGCAPAAIPCTGAGDCPAGSACDDGACEDDGAVDPAAPFVPSVEHVGQRREHRRAIVVPAAHVHGTLAGFPLLVRIDHDDAPRSIAHGGFALRDDGADLRFLADGRRPRARRRGEKPRRVLDEVRVADRALPSGWIETADANVRDADGFVIMGDDEAGP